MVLTDHEYKQHREQNHSPQRDILSTKLKSRRKWMLFQPLGPKDAHEVDFHFTERSTFNSHQLHG